MLSGNAQLLKIHEQKDDLAAKLAAHGRRSADAITKRWPAWERLLDFQRFARPAGSRSHARKSIAPFTDGRTLLAEPDPVPELTKQLATALRLALGKLQDDLAAAFSEGEAKLRFASLEPPVRPSSACAIAHVLSSSRRHRKRRLARKTKFWKPCAPHAGRPAKPARRGASTFLPRVGRGEPTTGTQRPSAWPLAGCDHQDVTGGTGPVARQRARRWKRSSRTAR
jgi:hypothetical protein